MRNCNVLLLIFGLAGAVATSGCANDSRDTENYGTTNRAAILQDPEQHMGGFGRTECLVCHNAALNIHRDKGSPISVDALNEAIRNNGEARFCLNCHGRNGT